MRDHCKSSYACLEINAPNICLGPFFVLSSWSFLKANLVSFFFCVVILAPSHLCAENTEPSTSCIAV